MLLSADPAFAARLLKNPPPVLATPDAALLAPPRTLLPRFATPLTALLPIFIAPLATLLFAIPLTALLPRFIAPLATPDAALLAPPRTLLPRFATPPRALLPRFIAPLATPDTDFPIEAVSLYSDVVLNNSRDLAPPNLEINPPAPRNPLIANPPAPRNPLIANPPAPRNPFIPKLGAPSIAVPIDPAPLAIRDRIPSPPPIPSIFLREDSIPPPFLASPLIDFSAPSPSSSDSLFCSSTVSLVSLSNANLLCSSFRI